MNENDLGIESIHPIEFDQIEPLLLRLFTSIRPDPYGTPIREDKKIKRILFGSTQLLMALEKTPFLKGLETIARRHGDKGFFVGAIVSGPLQFYFVPFSEKDHYWSVIEVHEQVIISEQGIWGFVLSDEFHGLLVMDDETDYEILRDFISEIDGEEKIKNMVRWWMKMKKDYHNYDVDCTWIRPQIVHVYGEEKAEQLMDGFDL